MLKLQEYKKIDLVGIFWKPNLEHKVFQFLLIKNYETNSFINHAYESDFSLDTLPNKLRNDK